MCSCFLRILRVTDLGRAGLVGDTFGAESIEGEQLSVPPHESQSFLEAEIVRSFLHLRK